MKTVKISLLLVLTFGLFSAQIAEAQRVVVSVNPRLRPVVYVAPRPVYVAPRPVVVPRRVYVVR